MPKYIYNSAEFTPISFKDRIAPYALYVEDYDKQQKDYLDMIEKTGDLDTLKDLPMDSEAYGIYSSWKNDIDRLGSIMSTEGLTPEARALALSLKQRQALDIDPLLKKQKIRSDLTKEKRAYLASHPNSFYDIDIETTPLSEITDSMAPRPYDIDSLKKSFASGILGAIQAGGGVDITNYNNIKESLGYDNLSKEKQARIDEALLTARASAISAYNDDMFDKKIKELTIANKLNGARRGSGYSGGSSSSSSLSGVPRVQLPDGSYLEIKKAKDGSFSFNSIDKKHQILTSEDINSIKTTVNAYDETETIAGLSSLGYKEDSLKGVPLKDMKNALLSGLINKAFLNKYYGGTFNGWTNDGNSVIPIIIGADGNQYVINNRGEQVLVSNNDYLSAYSGHNREYNINPISSRVSVRGNQLKIEDGDKEDYNYGPSKTYTSRSEILKDYSEDDLQKILSKNIYLDDIFKDHAEISISKITRKKGSTIVGYDVTIQPKS